MKTFSFSIPQMLVLNQLLQVPLWIGAPLDDASSQQKLSAALDELEGAGWIARQADGSVGIAEGLLAILQALRDAQSIAYAACLHGETQTASLTVFVDSGHYVMQTWQSAGLIQIDPFIDPAAVKSAVQAGLKNMASAANAGRLRFGTMGNASGDWESQDEGEIILEGEKSNGDLLKQMDTAIAAFGSILDL